MEPTFVWRTESDEAAPSKVHPVDDRLSADAALKRVSRGEHLLHSGDFHNAKQLLGAMGRRLKRPRAGRTPLEAFRSERQARRLEHETLSRILVTLDSSYRLQLARAPDVADACRGVWGEPPAQDTVVSFKTLLGMLGAAEWRRKGLTVPGLRAKLHPHYGVFLPTRTEYIQLLLETPEVKGKKVFDIGTGTGVLSFLLLQRGAQRVEATDVDDRAVACALENSKLLGWQTQFSVQKRDLFPEGKADLVVFNPPWIPEPPKNRVDHAVFDEDSQSLRRFLEGVGEHLTPSGEAWLILSDLAVLLGLRSASWLDEQFARSGLVVQWKKTASAQHSKSQDASDPLHTVRSREVTTLYSLTSAH